jgi:glycosyltransferase involved in cell wall biosynthesis
MRVLKGVVGNHWRESLTAGAARFMRKSTFMSTATEQDESASKNGKTENADRAAKKPSLSFFFPAFQDAGTVEKLVLAASEVLREIAEQWEIIIVNDGSFDHTGDVADECAQKYDNVIVQHHIYNIGYGAALKTGFYTAQHELIFYTDGDMQYDPQELKLLLPLLKDNVAIVSGYKKKRADTWDRVLSAKFYNWIVRSIFRIHVRDVDAAFKLMRREVIDNIELMSNGGFICAELFAKARKFGYEVAQLPVSHFKRSYGRSSAFNLFFILRSTIELLELWWDIMAREKFFALRQRLWRFFLWKKASPAKEESRSATASSSSASRASRRRRSRKSLPV